jgi:hypothetical protein
MLGKNHTTAKSSANISNTRRFSHQSSHMATNEIPYGSLDAFEV